MAVDTSTGVAFDDVAEFTPVFEDGTYVLTLVRIEPTEGQFGAGFKWVWNMVSHPDGERVMAPNTTDEAYEMFAFSSRKLTPRTKAYPWLAALLNRQLEIGESGAALAQAALGKSMLSYVGIPTDGKSDRQQILTAKPIAAKATAPRAVAAPAAPLESADDEEDEDALMAKLEAARARRGAANREKAGVSDEEYRAIFADQIPT